MYVKGIQITFDEKLLSSFDEDVAVKREGRSAVLRRLVADYLRRQRRRAIAEAYERAYASDADHRDDEWDGWPEEGVWPDA